MKRRNLLTLALAFAVGALPAIANAEDQLSLDTVQELVRPMPRSVQSSQSFYFVMTDRYANGNPANDHGLGGARDGFNPQDAGYYHGGDLQGLTQHLGRLKSLGFTALWITPPFVNNAIQGDSAAYHGYWINDFTQIDPHLGTEADFRAFVDTAHMNGLKVYLDIVVNHTGDIIKYYDGTGFKPAGQKDPYIPATFENVKAPAFLNTLANYHNQGDVANWDSDEQSRNGDFFGLDDIKTENPEVVDGFAAVFGDWVKNYGIDGFRIDTAKHVDAKFFERWIPKLLKAGNIDPASSGFDMFGEVYNSSSDYLAEFVRNARLPSVLDFNMQYVVTNYAGGKRTGRMMLGALNSDDFFNDGFSPDGFVRNAYSLPVFGGNHDMGRTAMLVKASAGLATCKTWDAKKKRPTACGRVLIDRINLANTVLFLYRGTPVTYYGDEVGMIGSGGDKSARQDMFPTKVSGWSGEDRVGSAPIGSGSSLTSAALKNPIAVHIAALNKLRSVYPALANGAVIKRGDAGNLIAWSRISQKDRQEFVVATNAGDKSVTYTVPTATPSSSFSVLLGKAATPKSDAQGGLRITVPARSSLVLRADKQLPGLAAAPTFDVDARLNYSINAPLLTAVSPQAVNDPLTVTFVARSCATCAWRRLGSDDNPPYRLVLADQMWEGSSSLDLAVLTLTSNGKVAAGAITSVTKDDFKD